MSGGTPSLAARVHGHVRLMRPYAWLWFDVLPAGTLLLLLDPVDTLAPGSLAAFLGGVVLADAGVSTLNDVCDVETDRLSVEAGRRERPIVTGLVSVKAASAQAALLLVAAPLVMGAASWASAALLTVAICFGVAYSLPPLRLCGRPGWSLLVWPLTGGAAYASAAVFAGRVCTGEAFLYLAGVGFLYVLGETMAKDIRDWDNDLAGRRRTTVIALGVRRAAAVSLVGCAIGGLLLASLFWWRDLALPTRLAGSVLLVVWTLRVASLVGSLSRHFDKRQARALHKGYISTYLWVNVLLLVDAGVRSVWGP